MSDSSQHPSHVNVVIAEDSRIQAKILQKHLVEGELPVASLPTVSRRLQMIQEVPPTIIISDIEMPEMDGYELCRRVKSDPQSRRIPVILTIHLVGSRGHHRRLMQARGQLRHQAVSSRLPFVTRRIAVEHARGGRRSPCANAGGDAGGEALHSPLGPAAGVEPADLDL